MRRQHFVKPNLSRCFLVVANGTGAANEAQSSKLKAQGKGGKAPSIKLKAQGNDQAPSAKTSRSRSGLHIGLDSQGGSRLGLIRLRDSNEESQRDSGLQPRVARNELPWENGPQCNNPNGVAARLGQRDATPLGLTNIPVLTQGSSFLATLGWRTQSRWDCSEFGSDCPKPQLSPYGYSRNELRPTPVCRAPIVPWPLALPLSFELCPWSFPLSVSIRVHPWLTSVP